VRAAAGGGGSTAAWPGRENAGVQRIKVTPELRDRAWRDFYQRHRRVLTLTEGQRRHIARVTERRLNGDVEAVAD
jgi:hypothetical protein